MSGCAAVTDLPVDVVDVVDEPELPPETDLTPARGVAVASVFAVPAWVLGLVVLWRLLI